MDRQIKLAKSILESAGYTVSKKLDEGRVGEADWSGWTDWVDSVDGIRREYSVPNSKTYAILYAPDYDYDENDTYEVFISVDDPKAPYEISEEGFSSAEEAKKFVEEKLGESMKESADLGNKDYILDTVDPAVSDAVKSISGNGFDDSSYDYKNGTLKGQGVVYIDKKKDTNKIHQRLEDAIKGAIESLGYENFRVYNKESEYNDPNAPFNSYRIRFRAHDPNEDI